MERNNASQTTTGETPIRIVVGDTLLTRRLWNNSMARLLTGWNMSAMSNIRRFYQEGIVRMVFI